MNLMEIKENKFKRYIAFALLSIFALFTVATASGYNFGYNLYVDGRYIGAFASEEDASKIAEFIYAEDGIKVASEEVVFGLVAEESFTSFEKAVETYKAGDARYAEGYVFCYGGEKVFAAGTLTEAELAKSEVLQAYSEDGAVRVEFAKDAEIVKKYALEDSFVDSDKAFELLSEVAEVETVIITSENKIIPFETEVIETEELYSGCTKVVTEGVNGEYMVERTTLKINGKVLSEYVSNEYTINEMQKCVVKKGTKAAPSGISTGMFVNPSAGVLTSPFGPRWGRMHKGIDISAQTGTPIYAADGGKVIYADWMSGYGYLVQIEHKEGYTTYYAHCQALHVMEGEYVTQGQHIADMGSTGNSTGTHLHFEIRINNEPVDPLGYVNY